MHALLTRQLGMSHAISSVRNFVVIRFEQACKVCVCKMLNAKMLTLLT